MIVVRFGILGVPQNWSNWTPNRMALYAKKKEWLETTILLGRIARVKSGLLPAEKGHLRRYITVAQSRSRYLDKDGLYASTKPIIDGLKNVLRRSIPKDAREGTVAGNNPSIEDATGFSNGKNRQDGAKRVGRKFETYQGAALIFDDDPAHADYDVTQEKTTGTPQVWIEVHIPES